jgi:hypothetical protein
MSEKTCVFCNLEEFKVAALLHIPSNSTYICTNCVAQCLEALRQDYPWWQMLTNTESPKFTTCSSFETVKDIGSI